MALQFITDLLSELCGEGFVRSSKLKISILAILAGLASVSAAHAAPVNLITNGSFESGVDTQSTGIGFVTVPGGNSTSITGWTVGGNSVDYIGSYWQPQQGSRSIDLSGNAPGALSQSFSTSVGQTYTVGFWIAGNPDGPPPTKSVDVEVTSNVSFAVADPLFNFTVGGNSRSNMGWQFQSFSFIGTGSDTLTFTEVGTTAYGTALDNVSVSAVPLPASAPLFGAALLALGVAGYGMKRKGSATA